MVWITLITLLMAFIAAFFSFLMWRTKRTEDLSILKTLYIHLELIQDSAKPHGMQLKSNGEDPSWPIPNFDINFYITHIKHKTRKEKGFCLEKTEELKKELIPTHERINTINYLWNRRLEGKKSDIGEFKYHKDLDKNIIRCKNLIKRIVHIQ